MSQEQGLRGRVVAGMIRRSVKRRYRSVYLRVPATPITGPSILYANHHSWMDGYLMYHVVKRLGLAAVDWIEAFDSFPLFALVGGLPFPKGNAHGRAATVRKTLRLMAAGKSLVLFPEGKLHRPPSLLPFGNGLEYFAQKLPQVKLVPVAIVQDYSLHERPEAWISLGEPHEFDSIGECEDRLEKELRETETLVGKEESFCKLVTGTLDVNERWGRNRK